MNKEDSLAKELKLLKEALACARVNDSIGLAEKFMELCAHQHEVMVEEVNDATNEVIRNAQRYARCKVQSRNDEGDQGRPNQEDNQGKES